MYAGILIEAPHQGDPSADAWVEKSGIIQSAHLKAERGDWRVFERSTPREIVSSIEEWQADNDHDCTDDLREARALAERLGLDATIHRGPINVSVVGHAEGWQPGEGDEFAAAMAYLGRDLSALYWITSAEEARALYDQLVGDAAPSIGRCGPVRVAGALRRECERIGWFETQADEDE